MDRILLATLGSLGDLHPYIAVGKALLARGQRVRLATSVDYRARVEAAGLEFAPLAPSIAELGDPELIAKQFFEPWQGPKRLLKAMVTAPLRRAYGDLCAAVEGVSIAVSHPITPALPLIAESRGLPWLSSVLAPTACSPTPIHRRFPISSGWIVSPVSACVRTGGCSGSLATACASGSNRCMYCGLR